MSKLKQRTRVREGAVGFRELYPNTFVNPEESLVNNEANLQSGKIERFGIRCRQCNFPIKDRRGVGNCPNCASDNFEGDRVTL